MMKKIKGDGTYNCCTQIRIMSMKKKILMIFAIIIAIIGFVYGIKGIKNFIIIQNIFEEIEKNIERDNYYLEATMSNKGEVSVTKTYYRDGIGKLVADNGVYTWVDGKKAYVIDEENKQYEELDIEKSLGLVSNEMFASLVPGYSKNTFERFIMCTGVGNSITSDKLDEVKTYKIKIEENKIKKIYWIEKNSNKITKARLEFQDGNVIEYDYKLQYDVISFTNLELPDLTTYTKIEKQT